MKIIFDSEEQKKLVLTALLRKTCPNDVGFKNSDLDDEGDCIARNCLECWSDCGIEMEISEPRKESNYGRR